MTNILIMAVVLTNWVNNGDFKREGGTNWVGQRLVCLTNVYAMEITLCTNKTLIKEGDFSTNGPTRWQPVAAPMVPGQRSKE